MITLRPGRCRSLLGSWLISEPRAAATGFRFVSVAALAFFALLAAAQDQTGGVSGTVVDAVTHQPVRKATVNINFQSGGGPVPQGAQGHQATTDATGAFSLGSLAAGRYSLSAQHQNYPQDRGGVRKTVEVKAGDTAGPVTLELIPGAVVTGHIADEDGDPLTGCNVQAHPARHPDQGVQFGQSNANENGEYRLFGIAPGKYIFSVNCPMTPFQPRPLSPGPDPPATTAYGPQYYPLASDAKSAQAVEVVAGSEKSGIDFRLRPTAVTQVRGKLSRGPEDWRAQPLILQLAPVDSPDERMMGARTFNQDQGTFEFPQVFPGTYFLIAFTQGDAQKRIGAVQRIEVKDRPIETVLELTHGMDLNGRVEIENSNNNPNKVSPTQINIQLLPERPMGVGAEGTQVKEDGTFTLGSVLPARYRLTANGPYVFLKSAWLGSADVTGKPLDFSAGGAEPIRIVLSTNTATINGTAPVGQTVYLSNLEDDFQGRNFRGASPDPSGRFTMSGVPPGKYRVFAADQGGPPPDEGGQEITVHEGETVTVDVKPLEP